MAPRNYARLHYRYWDDPVLEAIADDCPCAIAFWPLLVCLAKAASHDVENPSGIIKITAKKLAQLLRDICPVEDVETMLELLEEGEMISVQQTKFYMKIRLSKFDSWQTSLSSAAERKQNERDAKTWSASRDFIPESHGTVTGESRVSHGTVTYTDTETDTENKIYTSDSKNVGDPADDAKSGSLSDSPESNQTSVSLLPEIKKVFEHWRTATGRSDRVKLDAKRKSRITSRMKEGYSTDDLCKAIDWYAKQPFYAGDNPSGVRYDEIHTILRDAAQIDKALEATKNESVAAINPNASKPAASYPYKHFTDPYSH